MAAPAQLARGIDLSAHNGSYINKKQLDFVALRASIGLSRDVKFLQLVQQTQPIPIKVGWHYSYVRYPWKQQADVYLASIAGQGIHAHAWDYEKIGNVLTAATDADALNAIDYIEDKTSQECMLYSNLATIAEMHARGAGWVLTKKLWAARWFELNYYNTTATSPYSGTKLAAAKPAFWTAAIWFLWQYGGDKVPPNVTWTIPGKGQGAEFGVESHSIELDVANMTAAALRAAFGVAGDVPPDEAPPIELTMDERMQRAEDAMRSHGWEL